MMSQSGRSGNCEHSARDRAAVHEGGEGDVWGPRGMGLE